MLWTEEQDIQLRTLASEVHLAEIARIMDIPATKVWNHARWKKIKAIPRSVALQPTEGEYIGICREIAKETGIKCSALLGRSSKRRISHARWKVWQRMLEVYPHYSIGGIARAANYNHTSILHGLKRLAELDGKRQATDSGQHAKTANAIGDDENPTWQVYGIISGEALTARFCAMNKDEAVKQAHDHGITVATCEIAKPCPTNATRR